MNHSVSRAGDELDDIAKDDRGRRAACLHIVGRKNSGKTTLIVDLVRELLGRGLRVGTIKHTHHHHELDTPGKDSFRHRQAGASAVGIISPAMDAIFFPRDRDQETPSRLDSMTRLLGDCDVVLIEGGLSGPGRKIEVWRDELAQPPLALHEPSISAIVTDDPLPVEKGRTVWDRTDIAKLADSILKSMQDTSRTE